jgi:hypothetical protein
MTYKLKYEEYGELVTVSSTHREPLVTLLKRLFNQHGEEFELVFFGRTEPIEQKGKGSG